jgi:recombinational DNA repair ATPase RecF
MFSELDSVHRDLLLNAVSLGGSQVIVTSTDEEMLHHQRLEGVPEARVDTGIVSPVAPAGN